MASFPKLAQRRLSEMAKPDVHPDAVLLTGFIERALTPRLRVQVVEHLAACVECRSVVALAKPPIPVSQQEVFDWRRSFGWRPLRWVGGVATAAVMAGSLFVVRVEWMSRHQSAPAPLVEQATNVPVIEHPVVAATPEARPRSAVVTSNAHLATAHSVPPAKSDTREMIETHTNVNQMLDVRNGANTITGVAKVAPTQSEPIPSTAEQKVLWRIDGPGIVYESFDGGQRWQSVSIQDGLEFRSVTSVGSIVWAGGDAGALYKSEDSGLHWKRVPLLGDTQMMMSDAITSINFVNAKQGTIKTSHGMTWVTVDGGHTWQRQ
jgi:hypothetical protein